MRVEFKLSGADGLLRTLQMLPKEISGAGKSGPAAKAVRSGALVIMKQARANLRKAIAMPGKSGVTKSKGFTEKMVFVKRLAPRGGVRGERYIVSVIPRPHPSNREITRRSRSMGKRKKRKPPKPRMVKANDIAYMLEYGTPNQPATPWLRPAFETKKDEAVKTIISTLDKDIKRILATLDKGGPT